MKELPSMNEDVQINPVREILQSKDFFILLAGVGLLIVMVAPIPTIIMDILLALSFTVAFPSDVGDGIHHKTRTFFCFSYNFCSVQLYTDCV